MNFDDKVKELHRKEVDSFYAELSENSEAYISEVKEAGFSDTHSYETHMVSVLFRKLLFALIITVSAIALYLNL